MSASFLLTLNNKNTQVKRFLLSSRDEEKKKKEKKKEKKEKKERKQKKE